MHRTRDYITALPGDSLRAIVRSTNPTGEYRSEFEWAKAELQRRHNNAVHQQWHSMECM